MMVAFLLLGSAGCVAPDQQDIETGERPGSSGGEQSGGGVAGSSSIELPEPDTIPVYGKANRPLPSPPPPAWLVVGGEAVQASYGKTCEGGACNGREPQQLAEDLATVEVPASEEVFVILGSDRSVELSAGVVGWEHVPEGPSDVGPPSKRSVVPFFMRELDAQPVPEGEIPTVELASGGEGNQPSDFAVFALASTGNPGDRLLSVYAHPPGESPRPGQEDRTAYHWRLDSGEEGENLPPEEEGLPRVVELERGSETVEYSPEEVAEQPSLWVVAEEASLGPPGKMEEVGEGYLWALEEPEEGPRGRAGGPGGDLKGDPKEGGKTEGKAGPPPATTLLKLDPETRDVLSTIDEPGFGYTLDVGAGAVWVAGNPESGPEGDKNVARVDPETEAVETIQIGGRANQIAATEDGVWVAVGASPLDPRVVRLDPETGEVVAEIGLLGIATSVAVDEDTGEVWTMSLGRLPFEPAELWRIDPETNEISSRFEVEGALATRVVAAGGGTAWVAGPDGKLFEVDPRSETIKSTFVK